MYVINGKKYVDANNIGYLELNKLKIDGMLTIRVPKSTNQNIPYDTMCWSKTVKSENIRHEPRFVSMDIFNTNVSTARCIRYECKDLSKQVFSYKDHVYSHYVVIDDSFELPDAQNVKKRRLNENEIDELRSKILLYRTVAHAKVIAHQKGIDVTTKQTIFGNSTNFEEEDSEDDIDSRDDMDSENDMGGNKGSEDETASNDEMGSHDDINNINRIDVTDEIDSNDGSDANGNHKCSYSYDLYDRNESNAKTDSYDSSPSLRLEIAPRQKSHRGHPSDDMDDSMPSNSTERRRSSRKRHKKKLLSISTSFRRQFILLLIN
ncbi:hypothetical protein L3Y34_014103 [Caenorhabditis briggsae]|uniref:Uncharacterized protein n=1 Tax=Caenorhabditis briggsae TaxID=6238 RepID=A0AAE9DQW1_CAEBR|nr:hypothetical protein L3Y34_014103 [Caenorhabditis briggsae]